jgi:uncharacterized peroxidase-related enzyme
MAETAANGLPMIEEEEATGEVAVLYEEIKREWGMPAIRNFMKALAASPAVLTTWWAGKRTFYEQTTLPESLITMILYSVAVQNECQYCSSIHELSCRTLGVEEETLHTLIHDLPHLTPGRIRGTIEFALKVARDPKSLAREDYDSLREYGVGDDEIVEIIQIAAIGMSENILADALKVDVDTQVRQRLAR